MAYAKPVKEVVKEMAEDKEMKIPDYVMSHIGQLDRDLEKQKRAEEKTMTAENVVLDLQHKKYFPEFDRNDWDKIERHIEKILQ